MKVPFRELKKAKYFKESDILTGELGSDNIIRRINYVDNTYDYMRWLQAGDLVLLSGMQGIFKEDPDREALLGILKEHSVAGLAIYEYEFPEGVPKEFVDIALSNGLPVITLKGYTGVDEFIEYFTEHFYIRFFGSFMSIDDLREHFLRCYKEDKMQCIGKKLQELSGHEVFIKFYENSYGQQSSKLEGVLSRYNDWVLSSLDDAKLKAHGEFFRYQVTIEGQEIRWIGFHEYEDQEISKVFWMFIDDLEVDKQDLRLYYLAYKSIYLEFEKREYEFYKSNQQMINKLLSRKLELNVNSGSAEDEAIGLHKEGRVFLFSEELDERLYNQIYKIFRSVMNDMERSDDRLLLGNFENGLVAILLGRMERKACQDLAGRISVELGGIFLSEQKLNLGVGMEHSTGELSESYDQAKRTLFWTRRRADVPYGLYEELGTLRLLDTHLADTEIERLLEKYIRPIREQDEEGGGFIFETLRAFVRSLWNYTEASKSLFIHSNTAKYRIERAGELLQVDFNDRATRIEIEMAMDISDFLDLHTDGSK